MELKLAVFDAGSSTGGMNYRSGGFYFNPDAAGYLPLLRVQNGHKEIGVGGRSSKRGSPIPYPSLGLRRTKLGKLGLRWILA